jgi:hypothetical protein
MQTQTFYLTVRQPSMSQNGWLMPSAHRLSGQNISFMKIFQKNVGDMKRTWKSYGQTDWQRAFLDPHTPLHGRGIKNIFIVCEMYNHWQFRWNFKCYCNCAKFKKNLLFSYHQNSYILLSEWSKKYFCVVRHFFLLG